MTSKSTIHWLSLAGLVGIVVASYFWATTVSSLAALSPRMVAIFGDFFKVQALYLGLSLLLVFAGVIAPRNLALIGSAIFLLICMFASMIAVMMLSLLVVLVLMIGLHQDNFSGMINWMYVSGLFVVPTMLLNTVMVLLIASTAKVLKQNQLLKQWEIAVMLLGASWIGIAIA